LNLHSGRVRRNRERLRSNGFGLNRYAVGGGAAVASA